MVKYHTLGLTREIVEPWTRFLLIFLSLRFLQAVWIIATFWVDSHSAPITSAPFQITSCQSGSWPSTLFILGVFTSELDLTGFRVVRTIPGWTERGIESRACSGTACSLAASHHLKSVVRVAAGDIAPVFWVTEGVVKEVNWGGVCGASWASLFGIFLKMKSCL